MSSRRTKALMIDQCAKSAVRRRDGNRCILCGCIGCPDAHYISRAQSGLGIEQNVVTLCMDCHRAYDQSAEREEIKQEIRAYLMSKYKGWDESKLVYRKYD